MFYFLKLRQKFEGTPQASIQNSTKLSKVVQIVGRLFSTIPSKSWKGYGEKSNDENIDYPFVLSLL